MPSPALLAAPGLLAGLTAGPEGGTSLLGPLCAMGSSLTWAIGSTVYARTAARAGALRVNLWRALLVLPLFLLTVLVVEGARPPAGLAGSKLVWLLVSTVCSYGLGDAVFYLAAARLGTATALAIASVFPVWAALAGVLTLGEQISAGRLLGILGCASGVIWLVLLARGATVGVAHAGTDDARTARRRVQVGVALALLCSFFWAGNTYSIRRGAAGLPLFWVNAVRYGMAVIGLAVWLGLNKGRGLPRDDRLSQRDRLRFGGIVLLEAFGGSSLFVYGLAHADLSVGAPLASLAPLFSVPVGVMMGTERLSVRRLLAIALTVSGVVLLVRAS